LAKTLIGMVTYGNLTYSKLAYESIKNTTKSAFDFLIVDGKPTDTPTKKWVDKNNIRSIRHSENKGFPASLNDLYDYAFINNNYEYLIIIGNDIIAYPYSIDSLIKQADLGYHWVTASELSIKKLLEYYPQIKSNINTNKYIIKNLEKKPWELFKGYSEEILVGKFDIIDVHNMGLVSKKVFETIGYIDTNFYPAYFEDNDYAFRGYLKGLSKYACKLKNAYYFHFWSRTIHEGSGGSDPQYFEMNKNYYIGKWGGLPGKETYSLPYNGNVYPLTSGLDLPSEINIQTRWLEPHIINYWRCRHG